MKLEKLHPNSTMRDDVRQASFGTERESSVHRLTDNDTLVGWAAEKERLP
jgi:hypothetical protein